jgi:hypothetical protein
VRALDAGFEGFDAGAAGLQVDRFPGPRLREVVLEIRRRLLWQLERWPVRIWPGPALHETAIFQLADNDCRCRRGRARAGGRERLRGVASAHRLH